MNLMILELIVFLSKILANRKLKGNIRNEQGKLFCMRILTLSFNPKWGDIGRYKFIRLD